MDEKDKKPTESAPVETDKKKISIKPGQKNQIIINPPEKPPVKNVNELFSSARQKHAVVLEKKIELVLHAKAKQADLPEEALRQVYVRGFKNLPLNSQLTREQYAMNRVNSFVAGGAAMVEDCDLLPITERIVHIGRKGTGGGSRPHIKREKSPYNNKTVYHVVDAKGVVKHSTADEGEAKKHLATKYNSYLGEAKKLKGKDPCWDNYKMVGLKANGDPNCVGPVKEDVQQVDEISKDLANRYYWSSKSAGDKIDADLSKNVSKLRDKWSQRTHNKITDLISKSQKRTSGRLAALKRLNKEETEVKEATSVAIRMQRALDKIKAERERKERLAAPYVQSAFGKKDDNKPEPKKD